MGAEHTDVDGVEATDRGRHASIRTIGLYEAMPCLRNGHTHEDAALPAVLSPHLPGRHQGVGQRGSGQVGRLPWGCGRTQRLLGGHSGY